ncbi:MAG: ADP-ribosylation factor-like protein [Promethearchaeota archaeon]
MSINKKTLFTELLNNFLERNEQVEAVIVSDQDGLIIAGEKRKDIDMEIVSVLTSIVNPVLDRIRFEFDFKRFGSCSFETDNHHLIFISIDENIMISLVLESTASVEKISPYSYFLAEKISQIIAAIEGDTLQLTIPNFEYDAEQARRMKNQLYRLQIDSDGIYKFKFIIIGNHEVGKTSIVRRFVEGRFLADYRTTIGLNIISHKFQAFGNEVSAFLWDIGAQEYFRRYRKTYYNGAQAAFIVFDLTSNKSFENVRNWFNELTEFIENKDLPVIILGNKSDLSNERVVSAQEGLSLSKSLSEVYMSNISYIETSALTGEHIEDAFRLISYNYIVKCKEIEEINRRNKILNIIDSVLNLNRKLILTFITNNPIWNPALQLLVEINKNQELEKFSDEGDEKYFEYSNGLILKSCFYFLKDAQGSDGVFLIFDARNRDTIDPKWNYIIIKLAELLEKGKVMVIGLLVTENYDWSKLIHQFNISEDLQTKMGSILFFRIGDDYRSEIYNQLEVMLDSIRNNVQIIDLKLK